MRKNLTVIRPPVKQNDKLDAYRKEDAFFIKIKALLSGRFPFIAQLIRDG
jgi:hypothetical protein